MDRTTQPNHCTPPTLPRGVHVLSVFLCESQNVTIYSVSRVCIFQKFVQGMFYLLCVFSCNWLFSSKIQACSWVFFEAFRQTKFRLENMKFIFDSMPKDWVKHCYKMWICIRFQCRMKGKKLTNGKNLKIQINWAQDHWKQCLFSLRDWNKRKNYNIIFIDFSNETLLPIRRESSLLVVKFSFLGTSIEKKLKHFTSIPSIINPVYVLMYSWGQDWHTFEVLYRLLCRKNCPDKRDIL